MTAYEWEVQTINQATGGWHYSSGSPRGRSDSDLDPEAFARMVGEEYTRSPAPEARFRVVVWRAGDDALKPSATVEWGAQTPKRKHPVHVVADALNDLTDRTVEAQVDLPGCTVRLFVSGRVHVVSLGGSADLDDTQVAALVDLLGEAQRRRR